MGKGRDTRAISSTWQLHGVVILGWLTMKKRQDGPSGERRVES